jgi:diaminopimelate decarboxylase
MRCVSYRRAFSMTEMALPALALRNSAVAKWVRDQNLAVDVRSSEDLGVALAAGVHPARVTTHADALTANEILFCTANLAVGRVVVNSTEQVDLLSSVVPQRRQGVLVGMPDINAPAYGGSGEADDAIAAILDHRRLDLIGLQCEIGSQERDFISYPAAIGHMIAAMADIRDRHDVVLTRLSLGGGRAVPPGEWAVQLPKLASEIDESLDDACATLRFPRPRVTVSAGLAILGQEAA